MITTPEESEDSGHTLFTDNWYTSPILYDLLWKRKMHTELTAERCDFCPQPMDHKWHHLREKIGLVKDVYKPQMVLDYSQNMGAVDRTDMLQSSIESVRKSVKWYKKLFFHLLDMPLLNAHTIYKIKTGEAISIADFQVKLVKEILEHYSTPNLRISRGTLGETSDNPLRLVGRHFISKLNKDNNGKQSRRRCESLNLESNAQNCLKKYKHIPKRSIEARDAPGSTCQYNGSRLYAQASVNPVCGTRGLVTWPTVKRLKS
ncbi:hypothetical protein NQ315_014080 [Exocentrus adspersus]|uniref:PiggyBac transposable element-derived protein domain-containing protein n=1 Tax=Exocentrus adspersus TaxID=1586481 RepID=A0AAV8VV18_9CUCU|nr:hypothetical protein NQ315_014080 [Exocentrus adspersus]